MASKNKYALVLVGNIVYIIRVNKITRSLQFPFSQQTHKQDSRIFDALFKNKLTSFAHECNRHDTMRDEFAWHNKILRTERIYIQLISYINKLYCYILCTFCHIVTYNIILRDKRPATYMHMHVVHTYACSTEETCFQDSLQIQKRPLYNVPKMMKKCYLSILHA